MSDEIITALNTSDYKLNLELSLFGTNKNGEFNGSCLKQDKITRDHRKILNIYTVYEISRNVNISDYLTPENCLFGVVSLTKNADIYKNKYSGYGIGFDRHGFVPHPSSGSGRNVIVFGEGTSSSTKIDNRKKDIIILGKEHKMSAEKMTSINFTEHNKKFCLSLLYNGANRYLFVNGTEVHKSKAKDSEIVATP